METLSALNCKYVVFAAGSYGLYKYWQNRRIQYEIRVLSEIEKMPGFWRCIWTSLKEKYGVQIQSDNRLWIARRPSARSATINDLGWVEADIDGIIGEIQVKEVTGPKSFEEACEEVILYDSIAMRGDQSTAEDIHFDSWQQLWNTSHHGIKHDRPNWPGAPLKSVWIRQFDGDYLAIIAQKDKTTYYVVTYSAY